MKDKKSLISKCLIGGGLLALICGIFCFFGSAFTMTTPVMGTYIPAMSFTVSNLFSFMFGTSTTVTMSPDIGMTGGSGSADVVGGTTALFAIEMVIIVLAVILLIGIFAKKLQKKYITIGGCVVCVLAIAAVILAFCSKRMVINYALKVFGEEGTTIEQLEQLGIKFGLGSAGISYGVLGIVGILATGAGLFLGKNEAVAA